VMRIVIVSGMIFGARRFDKSSRLPSLSSYSLTQEAAPRARTQCMFSCSQIDEGRESPFRVRVRVRFEGRLEYSDKFLSLSLSPTRGRREARGVQLGHPCLIIIFLLSSESFFSPFTPCSRCRRRQ